MTQSEGHGVWDNIGLLSDGLDTHLAWPVYVTFVIVPGVRMTSTWMMNVMFTAGTKLDTF